MPFHSEVPKHFLQNEKWRNFAIVAEKNTLIGTGQKPLLQPRSSTKVGQKILFSTRAGTLAAENHVIAKSGGVCMKARFKYQKFLFYDRILEIKGSFLTVLCKQWLI